MRKASQIEDLQGFSRSGGESGIRTPDLWIMILRLNSHQTWRTTGRLVAPTLSPSRKTVAPVALTLAPYATTNVDGRISREIAPCYRRLSSRCGCITREIWPHKPRNSAPDHTEWSVVEAPENGSPVITFRLRHRCCAKKLPIKQGHFSESRERLVSYLARLSQRVKADSKRLPATVPWWDVIHSIPMQVDCRV